MASDLTRQANTLTSLLFCYSKISEFANYRLGSALSFAIARLLYDLTIKKSSVTEFNSTRFESSNPYFVVAISLLSPLVILKLSNSNGKAGKLPSCALLFLMDPSTSVFTESIGLPTKFRELFLTGLLFTISTSPICVFLGLNCCNTIETLRLLL